MTQTRLFTLLAAVYVALVVLANWLASRYLVTIPWIGRSYTVPAGVLAVGAVLVIRDWLQQLRGLGWAIPLMVAAGALSYIVGIAAGWTSLQKIAVASVCAFACSETLEAVVFTPLRNRNLTAGVIASGVAGSALDTYVFLVLAFGSSSLAAFFAGTFIAKVYMVAAGGLVTAGRRRLLPVLT
jgi:uncharacterized PurR-regulated membrane protein YhhQ (DUF165 family)